MLFTLEGVGMVAGHVPIGTCRPAKGIIKKLQYP